MADLGEQEAEAKPPVKSTGCMLRLGLAAVLIALFVAWGMGQSRDSDDSEAQQMGAQIACEEMVRDRLKSPSTADFSDVSTSGFGPYIVRGSVDSQNSFGATIRSSFSCNLELSGSMFRGTVTVL